MATLKSNPISQPMQQKKFLLLDLVSTDSDEEQQQTPVLVPANPKPRPTSALAKKSTISMQTMVIDIPSSDDESDSDALKIISLPPSPRSDAVDEDYMPFSRRSRPRPALSLSLPLPAPILLRVPSTPQSSPRSVPNTPGTEQLIALDLSGGVPTELIGPAFPNEANLLDPNDPMVIESTLLLPSIPLDPYQAPDVVLIPHPLSDDDLEWINEAKTRSLPAVEIEDEKAEKVMIVEETLIQALAPFVPAPALALLPSAAAPIISEPPAKVLRAADEAEQEEKPRGAPLDTDTKRKAPPKRQDRLLKDALSHRETPAGGKRDRKQAKKFGF